MLRLETLGSLRLLRDGVELTDMAAQRRRLLLLAVVAASGEQGIPRPRVLTLFWPESDEAHARNALKQTVFALRRDLQADPFGDSGALRLDTAVCTSDIGELFAASASNAPRAVADLARGPFLDGVFAGDSAPLEDWMASTRSRADALTDQSLRQLADQATARGEHEAVVRWLLRLAERRPLDAAVAVRLIHALDRAGDATAALQVAERHEHAMLRDLELPPDPTVTAALRQVRARLARGVIGALGETPSAAGTASDAADDDVPRVLWPSRDFAPSPLPAPPAGPAESASRDQKRHDSTTGHRPWVSRRLLVWGAAIALVGMTAVAVRARGGRDTRPPAAIRVRLLPVADLGSRRDVAALATDLLAAAASDASVLRTNGQPSIRIVTGDIGAARSSAAGPEAWILRASTLVDGDRVTLSAKLVDARDGGAAASASVTGRRSELAALALRVVVRVLEPLLDSRARALVRVEALESRDQAALESYLLGVAASRRRRWEDAVAHFSRSVRADSGFAIAWYRLALACDWAGNLACWSEASHRAARQAGDLPEHERLLLEATRAVQTDYDEAERRLVRLVSRFPEDEEAWFRLGELQFHFNPPRGRSPIEAEVAYRRALALVPDDAEVLEHLARIAAVRGNPALVDSTTRLALANEDTARLSQALLFGTLAGSDTAAREALIRRFETIDEFTASIAVERAMAYGGAYRVADRIFERLEQHARSPATRTWATIERALVAATEGRVAAARAHLTAAERVAPFEARMAWRMLHAIPSLGVPAPPALPSGRREGGEYSASNPQLWNFRGGPVEWRPVVAAAFDANAAPSARAWDRVLALAPQVTTEDPAEAGRRTATYAYAAAIARGTLDVEPPPYSFDVKLILTGPLRRWIRASGLEASGRTAEAATAFGGFRHGWAWEIAWEVPARLQRARLLERLGHTAEALEEYGTVETLWRDADPALQPIVAEARAGRQRLRGVP